MRPQPRRRIHNCRRGRQGTLERIRRLYFKAVKMIDAKIRLAMDFNVFFRWICGGIEHLLSRIDKLNR